MCVSSSKKLSVSRIDGNLVVLKQGYSMYITPPDLNLYPHPATNSLIITAEATLGTIKIASVLGVVVMQLTTTKNETNIDVSQLPSGIYFINCNGTSEKFVKE